MRFKKKKPEESEEPKGPPRYKTVLIIVLYSNDSWTMSVHTGGIKVALPKDFKAFYKWFFAKESPHYMFNMGSHLCLARKDIKLFTVEVVEL